MKKKIAIGLAAVLAVGGSVTFFLTRDNRPVLKIANWAEYIDGGDENSELIEEFEDWYKEKTGEEIRVEYCIADDNETLYNMIKMGDYFDLICPSEYMIMKLAAEDRLMKLPEEFFDKSNPDNYYVNNVSKYIQNTFENNSMKGKASGSSWSEYAAGYMWGTTGFVYNPEELVNEDDVSKWSIFTNPEYANKITAKNNVRDTYFIGLAMHYEEQLQALKTEFETGIKDQTALTNYQSTLSLLMNDAQEETMNAVKPKLKALASNLYGFETDEGKNDMIGGKISVNYQWSGDAVYIMDYAQGDDEEDPVANPVYLNYCIPDTVSNLWFDGWVLPKDCKNVTAATMFINFLSKPENAVRNMEYIGYTSCIAGDYVFENYAKAYYEAEEDDTSAKSYDLNYYFNPSYVKGDPSTISEAYIFLSPEEQFQRQLFAQYPDEETLTRCVAMSYFDREENTRANLMWNDITFL